ncbi:MAG TPA: glycoside hydrolase family 3 C-terminal domain-containing protein [Acidimicrobiales bacterium]
MRGSRGIDGLSLDEKAALTGGADVWHTVAVERVGIPALRMTDGPSGARGDRYTGGISACVPCGSALASTWNRELVRRVGGLLADEARAKGAQLLLAPTVNIHRHPLAGRNFECFSEDPYLTSELAVAYIEGVQGRGVGCAVKHFVANDQEHDRMEVSVEADERTLREIYFPPFEAAVRRAGVWAVMAAYNRLSGVHCSEHAGLLTDVLRKEWGFDGLVVSDWFGTHSTLAVAAGLDVEMPGPPRFMGEHLAHAVRQGDVDEAAVDRAARAVVRLIDRTTAIDPTTLPPGDDPVALARQAAREAIVLLRNEPVAAGGGEGEGDAGTPLLPLDATALRRLAVLGVKAGRPDFQGGGSAHVDPPHVVTPLDGLTRRAGAGVTVVHEAGVAARPAEVLGRDDLAVPGTGEPGVCLEYHLGDEPGDLAGEPVHRETVPRLRLFWLGPPAPGLPPGEAFSVRATAELTPDRSGTWTFGLTSAGRSRVLLDGELLVDNMAPTRGGTFFGRGSTEVTGTAELKAGTTYHLEAHLFAKAFKGVSVSGLALTAEPPADEEARARAVAAAEEADAAVVVVGTELADSEGADRRSMDLPAAQVELIREVAAANPRTVVVLNTGSPVTMDWLDEVPAVVQLWYTGQELGDALADVLFGDVDASGRLPTTFPRRIEDTPAFPTYPGTDGRAPYGEGLFVGYRHYDSRGVEPLFPFGHGLSYTRFAYGDLVVEGRDVRVTVTNVGERPGREVVQLYLHHRGSADGRPEQELKDFQAVDLAPGEAAEVAFSLPDRAFARWDLARHGWTVEKGEWEVRVGSSSRAIHATGTLTLS